MSSSNAGASAACPSPPAAAEAPQSVDDAFKLYRKQLYGFVRRRSPSSQEAEDIVQDVYLRVLQEQRPPVIRNLKAFLFACARNLTIDLSRRRRMQREAAAMLESDESVEPAFDESIDTEREIARLRAAIEELPPRCREVFYLFRFEEMSQQEIAQRLGITVNAVEKHVMRALRKCEKALR